ncbi:MAG: LLM class flavin-dependent oxidoreductase [Planctomycetes bacterium]|nr:LLM class flavin-dependent oxidoreductase [Planctomycetota bacterium]
MDFDVFFSISHTPVAGALPSEAQMFRSFFRQVEAADELGYGTAWIAESHLSTEVQKRNRRPVVPHFQGEVGLNVDFCQMAHQVFRRTRRIECGSAVMNILCNGGPVAAAERVAACCALHGCDPAEARRIHVGFAAGRFEFMNRAYGIDARDPVEEAAWPALKGLVFREAAHVFLRLLRGEVLSSADSPASLLERGVFRSDEDWLRVQRAHAALRGGGLPERIAVARRYEFEQIKIVPQEWRRELCVPVVGSHDPALQQELNRILPVQVFNLSITEPEVIEQTHRRMTAAYHPEGGKWRRSFMPRTVMVFLDDTEAAARERAEAALGEYWKALEGTIDPAKVARATENALMGTPAQVAAQVRERFHPDDRLMLWFDFYDHDCDRVVRGLERFAREVAPILGPAVT